MTDSFDYRGINPQLRRELYEAHSREAETSTQKLAEELSLELRSTSFQILNELLDAEPLITNKYKREIIKRDTNFLRIELTENADDIIKTIQECTGISITQSIKPDEILMTLRIPPHLYNFWSKQEAGLIAWGKHYEKLIDHIWSIISSFAQEHALYISRINPPRLHDNAKYYYLFLIQPQDGRPEFDSQECIDQTTPYDDGADENTQDAARWHDFRN